MANVTGNGTGRNAHDSAKLDEKRYAAGLVARGIAPGRIRAYGVAFRDKEVLVG